MDDLDLVRGLGADTPLPAAADLAPARHRLLAAAAAERAGTRPAPERRAPGQLTNGQFAPGQLTNGQLAPGQLTNEQATPGQLTSGRGPAGDVAGPAQGRRLRWAALATTGIAAAITATLVLVPPDLPVPPGPGAPAGPTVQADAARVLRAAAVTALAQPAAAPRPDQFLYTRTRTARGERESWHSMDGTRDGLIRNPGEEAHPAPGCPATAREGSGDSPVEQGGSCVPDPAYRSDLPTDAAGMQEYLGLHRSGEPGDVNALGKDVGGMLHEKLVPPAARAALFEAVATVPGLTVVADVRDAAGRPGVGVSWSHGDEPTTLVLDPSTHEFLGWPGEAVLASGVVDEVGQRP